MKNTIMGFIKPSNNMGTTVVTLAYILSLLPREFPKEVDEILKPNFFQSPSEYLLQTIDGMCKAEWHDGYKAGEESVQKQIRKEQKKLNSP